MIVRQDRFNSSSKDELRILVKINPARILGLT
jgi:hypothetical protein